MDEPYLLVWMKMHPPSTFTQCRLSCGLKWHSFGRTRSLHELGILRNKRLKSFGVLNSQGSRRQNGLDILHCLPNFLGHITTRGLLLHAQGDNKLSYHHFFH